MLADVPHDGGRLGAELAEEALGIGLLQQRARLRLDLVLVDRALAQIRDEQLPDAGAAALAHRVRPAIPAVEVADHAHALGVGRPDGEDDARGAAVLDDVGAELLIRAEVVALVEKLQVEVAQDGQEAVRVATLAGQAVLVQNADLVGEDLLRSGELGLKEIGALQPLEGLLGAIGGDRPRLFGMREKGADRDKPCALHLHDVRAEHLEGIVMIGVENSIELVLGDSGLHDWLLGGAALEDIIAPIAAATNLKLRLGGTAVHE